MDAISMPITQERSTVITHLHWIVLARDLGIIAVALLLPFIILGALLPSLLPDTVFASVAQLLPLGTALWVLILWMMIAMVWTKYYLSVWIITNEYLIYVNQIGLFNREVSGWDTHTIQSTTAHNEGLLQSLLDYGDIWIKTSDTAEDEYIIAATIPYPDKVCTIILEHVPKNNLEGGGTETQEALLHSISHEMKGHLTRSQATFASIVQGDFGVVPENLKNVAGAALADTREGVETIMNILNSSNFKKGTLSFDKERFDLSLAVRESIDELRQDFERKGILLRFRSKASICFIEGDREKLKHHVLRNLIDNAIRYTPAGTIDVEISSDNEFVTVSVLDTGVGISPSDMQHLFTEGGKGSGSNKTNPQSTGYGLFVAKMVVEGHGGEIWATSDGVGAGSCFFAKLPIHATHDTAPPVNM